MRYHRFSGALTITRKNAPCTAAATFQSKRQLHSLSQWLKHIHAHLCMQLETRIGIEGQVQGEISSFQWSTHSNTKKNAPCTAAAAFQSKRQLRSLSRWLKQIHAHLCMQLETRMGIGGQVQGEISSFQWSTHGNTKKNAPCTAAAAFQSKRQLRSLSRWLKHIHAHLCMQLETRIGIGGQVQGEISSFQWSTHNNTKKTHLAPQRPLFNLNGSCAHSRNGSNTFMRTFACNWKQELG